MPDSSSSDQLIPKALKKVLSALVRLVVRFGITYPEFLEVLKRAYVEEVRRDLERKSDKITLSRISVVSGVHRKDVKRFTDETSEAPSEKMSLTSRLVNLWLGDSQYLDEQGKPKGLPRQGDTSFESLVRSVSRDVRPRTILDEWCERGLVEECDGLIRLNPTALYPSDDLATKISFFAHNVADHIATCEHNLRDTHDLYPERSVLYRRLSKESVDTLQHLANEESQAALVRINKKAQQLAKQDELVGAGDLRFICGMYCYREQEPRDDLLTK